MKDAIELAQVDNFLTLAKQLATSELIPRALKGKPGDVLVVLLTGKEFGLQPMQALRGIHVVDGKAVMAADLIAALCARERSVCEYFRMAKSTDAVAEYTTKRAGHPEPVTLAFTIQQAQAAGLTNKDNWRKYPAAMLRARCASALARAVYPDLVAGVYDPDELDVHAPPSALPIAPKTLSRVTEEAEVQEAPPVEATDERDALKEKLEETVGGKFEYRNLSPRGVKGIQEKVGFGPHKDKVIADLTNQQLTESMALAEEQLKTGKLTKKQGEAVKRKLALLDDQLDLHMDREKALADHVDALIEEAHQ